MNHHSRKGSKKLSVKKLSSFFMEVFNTIQAICLVTSATEKNCSKRLKKTAYEKNIFSLLHFFIHELQDFQENKRYKKHHAKRRKHKKHEKFDFLPTIKYFSPNQTVEN